MVTGRSIRLACVALACATGIVAATPSSLPAQAPSPAPADDRPAAHADAYDVGAAFANAVWVPTRLMWCGVSAGMALTALVATVGAARDWAASAFEASCLSGWLLTGDDFRGPTEAAPSRASESDPARGAPVQP